MPPGKAALIGVPLDLGASKRGAAGGPAAIRRTELAKRLEELGLAVEDLGDVPVPSRALPGSRKSKYASAILKVCRELAKRVHGALRQGAVPVTLGGDHSLAMGSASGAARHCQDKKGTLGLIWVDAHGDINTPQSSTTGNVHGMPLAHLLGMGDRRLTRVLASPPAVDARRVCLVGIRDLDPAEKVHLRQTGVRVFTMADIDRQGMARVAESALEAASDGTAGVHVSFDIDAADPSIAQGVGTPKRGGLTYREAHLFMEMMAESGRLLSLDMTEVNPLEDTHNMTAELASELVQSALGKKIY